MKISSDIDRLAGAFLMAMVSLAAIHCLFNSMNASLIIVLVLFGYVQICCYLFKVSISLRFEKIKIYSPLNIVFSN